MGGYGAFIWSAYAVVFLIVAALTAESLSSRARARRLLNQLDTEGENR
nr:heme exporter protein CcmD [Phaeovibrio sulfidiphilus]